MADFNFYLNRQGVKGNKGEKGETGFAPIVEVAEDTAASYKLRIITDTDTLETPNLRGSAVDDLGGTYMRYDPETQKMYAAAADTATTSSKGEVILASDEAIADLSDVHALTPASLVDNYDALIQSSDGSVVITQDANNSKIDLSVDLSSVEGDISGLDSRITGCETAIGNIEGDIIDLQNNKVDKEAGKGLSTNDFTNADKSKLDSSLQPTSVDGTTIGLNSGGQLTLLAQIPTVPTNISAFTNDSGYITSSALNGYATENFVTSQGYITSSALTPYVLSSSLATVATTGDYSDLINKPTIPTVNNGTLTIQQNGTTVGTFTANDTSNVTANISVPTDTNDLTNGAGFITSVPTATTSSLGLVQPDGSTITINNGVISASSSAPSNMVTTDTNQTITANKTFNGNVDKDFSGDTLRLGASGAGRTGLICLSNTGARTWSICNSGYTASTLEIADFNTVTIQGGNLSSDSKLVVGHNSLVFHKSDNTSVDLLAGSIPSNMVTTDTAQTISGSKTFSSDITMSWGSKFSFISDSAYIGEQVSGYNIGMVANRTAIKPQIFKVGKEGLGTNYGLEGYFFDTSDGGNCIWLGETNYRSAITTTNGQGVAIYPNPLTNNAQERLYIGLNDTLTYRKSDGTVVDLLASSTPSNMVTTNTSQTISGHKVFSDYSTEIKNSLYVTKYGTSQIFMGEDTSYAVPILSLDDTNDILTIGDTGKYLKLKAYNTTVVSNQRGNEFTVGYDTLTYKKSDDTVVDLLSGGAVTIDQTYDATSANAQSGVAIAGAGFLNNSATQSSSLAIKATTAPTTYSSTILNGQSVTGNAGTAIGYGTRAVYMSTALGANSYGQGNGSTAIGNNATSGGVRSIAIGGYNPDTMAKAHASAQDAIQIGIGQNSTASSLAVGFNGTNYQLLDGTTGLIPNSRIDSNLIDGQWVMSYSELANNVSIAASSSNAYSLATYLPNDNYDYEVIVSVMATTGNTSGNSADILIGNDAYPTAYPRLLFAITRTNASVVGAGQGILVVSNSDRRVVIGQASTTAATLNFVRVFGYRRIGTNN